MKIGLELHPQKAKIQHNGIGYGSNVRATTVQGRNIEVLDPSISTMYLGRALSLTDAHCIELQHLINKAWAEFGMLWYELVDETVSLDLRLRLFRSVLTPTVMYGCSS